MRQVLRRRQFLAQSAAATALATGYFVNPGPAQESKSPNERLNLAAIGATGRAGANIKACASQNIVAIADVDADLLEKERPATPMPASIATIG